MVPLTWRVLVSLLIFFGKGHCRPVEDEAGADAGGTEGIKVSDEDVAEVIKDLEALISKIPLEQFDGDTKLHQVIDTLNEVTSYKANGTSKDEPSIYERLSSDKDKKAIVLKPSEDKITVRKAKKTYVGLRHSGEGSMFYVFYIYLRDPASGDGDFTKKIGGVDKLVEYDSWENREDKLQKVNNGFGWSDCSSSIFIPCKTTDKIGFAPPRVDHRAKADTQEEVTAIKVPPKPEGHFSTEAGFDADENVDFFWDLEDDIQKARFIGVGLDLLAGGLQAIPNLLTGIFGGITDGIGGLLSGVVSAGGQLVSGVVSTGANMVTSLVSAAGNMVSSALQALLNVGGGLVGAVGSGVQAAVDLGSKFVGGVATMVGQGVNAAVNVGTGIVKAGIDIGTGVVKMGMNLVAGMFEAGLGLVNSLLSFGGLGGPKANPNEVGLSVGINLGGGGSFGAEKKEVEEGLQRPESGGMGGLLSLDLSLEADASASGSAGASAGGGGAAGRTIDAEAAINDASEAGGAAAGRAIGAEAANDDAVGGGEAAGRAIGAEAAINDASEAGGAAAGRAIGAEAANDDAADEKQGRALLIIKLAEIIATKMGENFGKEILKTGLVEHPGWKTMDEAGAVGNTLTHEDDAFVGFGGCEYVQVTAEQFFNAKSASEILKLLTTALRTQCVSKEIKMYEQLIDDKFLVFDAADKTFNVPKDNKYLHMEKLNPRRRSDLSRAFEMSLFSKAFKAELFNEVPQAATQNSEISRRVYTLGEVVIHGIELVGKDFKCHQVKLLRSLLTTVKAAFTKLLQDYEVTRDCAECEQDLTINRNDQTYLMTLMEFILHGLAPVQKNSEDVKTALTTFNATNAEVINNRVENYLL